MATSPPAALADYDAGKRALEAGQPDQAAAQWRAAAKSGDRRSMLALGRLFAQGRGVVQDYVEAHKWFNLAAGIRISMDGRGRCMDNIFIERLWRSLKYEAVYLHEIADGFTARRVIGERIGFYNTQRPHSALGGRTPAEAYRGDMPVDMMDKPLRALPTSPQAQQQQEDRFKGILAA